MAKMSPHGAFTNAETKQFDRGGPLSTPAERMKVPANNFLMPDQRKYPYKVNGKISCDLLRAAQSRAKQNGEPQVAEAAKRLFDEHCGT